MVRIVEVEGGSQPSGSPGLQKESAYAGRPLRAQFRCEPPPLPVHAQVVQKFRGRKMQSIAYAMAGRVVRHQRRIPSMLTKKLDRAGGPAVQPVCESYQRSRRGTLFP